jgi:hypothetical protein
MLMAALTVILIVPFSAFAQEEPYYKLVFDAAGGEFYNGSETLDFYLHAGDEVSDVLHPTRKAYTFVKWDKDLPATMPAKNIQFTAVWEKIPGADETDGKFTVDKVELSILKNRVYADAKAEECLIEGKVPKNAVYGFGATLEKLVNGEWTDWSADPVGSGTFRWKISFDIRGNYSSSYKFVEGVTKVYIDGELADYSIIEYYSDSRTIYTITESFKITEKDTKPEPEIIKEVRVDGVPEPVEGENIFDFSFDYAYNSIVVPDNINIVLCEYLALNEIISRVYTLGLDNTSTFKKGKIYYFFLELVPVNGYYRFNEDTKCYINGKEFFTFCDMSGFMLATFCDFYNLATSSDAANRLLSFIGRIYIFFRGGFKIKVPRLITEQLFNPR